MKSLIVGLGNIGLRHIQGLSKLNEKKNDFYIFDNSIDYLSRFKNEIDDLKNKNNLIFTKNLENAYTNIYKKYLNDEKPETIEIK